MFLTWSSYHIGGGSTRRGSFVSHEKQASLDTLQKEHNSSSPSPLKNPPSCHLHFPRHCTQFFFSAFLLPTDFFLLNRSWIKEKLRFDYNYHKFQLQLTALLKFLAKLQQLLIRWLLISSMTLDIKYATFLTKNYKNYNLKKKICKTNATHQQRWKSTSIIANNQLENQYLRQERRYMRLSQRGRLYFWMGYKLTAKEVSNTQKQTLTTILNW